MTRFTTWSLTVLFSAALLAIAPPALAVDGTILINQNTSVSGLPGCPNSGFPIIICQPGSYKLSGNLMMSTTPAGNYAPLGSDIAIAIAHSGVVLDLNGFSITITNTNASLNHNVSAIGETSAYSQIAIRNGTIVMNSVALNVGVIISGIFMRNSDHISIQDLSIANPADNAFFVGAHSLIRHNYSIGLEGIVTCPSLVVENVGGISGFGAGSCTFVNNVP